MAHKMDKDTRVSKQRGWKFLNVKNKKKKGQPPLPQNPSTPVNGKYKDVTEKRLPEGRIL